MWKPVLGVFLETFNRKISIVFLLISFVLYQVICIDVESATLLQHIFAAFLTKCTGLEKYLYWKALH